MGSLKEMPTGMKQRCGDRRTSRQGCGLKRGPIWSEFKLQPCQLFVNPYVSEFTCRMSARETRRHRTALVLDASHGGDSLLICVLHKFDFIGSSPRG